MPCHANNLSWEPAVFYVISINPEAGISFRVREDESKNSHKVRAFGNDTTSKDFDPDFCLPVFAIEVALSCHFLSELTFWPALKGIVDVAAFWCFSRRHMHSLGRMPHRNLQWCQELKLIKFDDVWCSMRALKQYKNWAKTDSIDSTHEEIWYIWLYMTYYRTISSGASKSDSTPFIEFPQNAWWPWQVWGHIQRSW